MDLFERFKRECKSYYDGIINYGIFSADELERLLVRIDENLPKNNISPAIHRVFEALKATSFEEIIAIILAQDPYPHAKTATGVAFETRDNSIPPTLKNILKEVYKDRGMNLDEIFKGVPSKKYKIDLRSWTNQGVLLLNTYFTTDEGKRGSHKDLGWEELTSAIIKAIDKRSQQEKEKVVFMLWGNDSIKVGIKNLLSDINEYRGILVATHPGQQSFKNDSEIGQAFKGCDYFNKTNGYLEKKINWDTVIKDSLGKTL